MIIFKKKYLDLVRQGRKTMTVRCWKKDHNLKSGDIVAASNYRDSFPIRIVSVEFIKCQDLNEEHAKADGFETLKDLREALEKIYGNLDFVATVIRFQVV